MRVGILEGKVIITNKNHNDSDPVQPDSKGQADSKAKASDPTSSSDEEVKQPVQTESTIPQEGQPIQAQDSNASERLGNEIEALLKKIQIRFPFICGLCNAPHFLNVKYDEGLGRLIVTKSEALPRTTKS